MSNPNELSQDLCHAHNQHPHAPKAILWEVCTQHSHAWFNYSLSCYICIVIVEVLLVLLVLTCGKKNLTIDQRCKVEVPLVTFPGGRVYSSQD